MVITSCFEKNPILSPSTASSMIPSWFCESASSICCVCLKRGGCAGLLILQDITRQSVFGGWKVTSHFSAKSLIIISSEERSSAVVLGLAL